MEICPDSNGGCKVTLSVDYDFGMPSLTDLIGPTLKEKVRENSEMMLEGMKKKIEG
jgi:coenzyme Q-binding protein COQ10